MVAVPSASWKLCGPQHFDYYDADALWNVTTEQQTNDTWTHKCSDKQTCSSLALTSTVLRIYQKIQTSELGVCTSVADYIRDTNIGDIISTMIESMHDHFPAFVLGMNDNFLNLDLKTFQKDILTSEQGVYAAIVYRAHRETCLYVGSSYGKEGIKNRVIRNHLRQSYRSRDPTKPLYVMMDEPGANTFFIRLSSYRENVPTAQVLLTESVCCSMFGTFSSEIYQQVRLKGLPEAGLDHGLNRSDPLQTWRSGVDTIGNDASSYRRLRTLDNCLKSGPMRVGFHRRRKSTINGSYQFTLFDENFTIPKAVAEHWMLRSGSVVNVQWDVSAGFHQHPFAPMAKETDDGRRIGIRVFQENQQVSHEHWIVRNTQEAVTIANTLHDFLTGQIVGKPYRWDDSRKYIFQDSKHYTNRKDGISDSADIEAERRVRVGLPYCNRAFVWDDRTRKPETRPGELKLEAITAASDEGGNEYAVVTSWVEQSIATEYQTYLEEQYERWLLPYHRDLQRQGCRIYTRKYVE
ncbi:hypothetical protein V492_05995 [Pseudogymnoascus sp. VKM F-4246]|nr:hypothetical protein V492_05995 [Pseudogymnoascus sp. VKM F-4246]